MRGPDIDRVTTLLREVVDEEVLPRFRRLGAEEILYKQTASDADDIVTVVDPRVEERLARVLEAQAPLLGEEAVHARPELLDLLAGDGPLWLLDPIDGTRSFARGDDAFGVMLAWVADGATRAAWLLLPARESTVTRSREA